MSLLQMHVGMWLLQLCILLVLLPAAIIQVGAQILNSTLPSDYQVCPGEEVIFTCVVQGPHLAWSSEEYIGSGGKQPEFGAQDHEKLNKTVKVNSLSNVTLLNISETNGVTRITSQFEIIASAEYSTSSVVCHDVSAGTSQHVHFNVTLAGEYLTILLSPPPQCKQF